MDALKEEIEAMVPMIEAGGEERRTTNDSAHLLE